MSPRRILAFTVGFLLAYGVAVSKPGAVPMRVGTAHAGMMAFPMIPDSVISVNGWVRVHFEPGVFKCGPWDAWGCYTYETRTMQVDTALSSGNRWEVLEHEKVHMILGDAGLNEAVRDNHEGIDDEIADAIARVRMLEILTGTASPLAKSR